MSPSRPPGTEHRTARLLRRGLMVSASASGLGLLAIIAHIVFRRPPSEWLGYGLLISLALSLLFGLAHFFYVLFAKVQARLGEWMITFLVGAALATALIALYRPEPNLDEADTLTAAGILFGTVVCTIIGSAWGWSVCQQLKEQDGRRRLSILAYGWLLVLGAAGFAMSAVIGLIFVAALIGGISFPDLGFFFYYWLGGMAASPCMIPGLSVAARARRAAREQDGARTAPRPAGEA
ncbi:MAG: hypothetical protein KIS92_02970 [Planctomycetota bacterium]|nr:hypothetical protein [Planctomycetota bacterium]